MDEKVEKIDQIDQKRIIKIIIDLMKGIELTNKTGKQKKTFVIEAFTDIMKSQLISEDDEKFVDALMIVLPVMIDTFKTLDVNNLISAVSSTLSCCSIF